jgi:hypothetical protein
MPTTVRVTWPANPAEEQVSNYRLYQSVNGGSFNFLTDKGTSTQHDILNPSPGVYAFKVEAQNLAGNSPQSDPGSSPGTPSKPGTPTVTVIVT